jgi:hypothetical protein
MPYPQELLYALGDFQFLPVADRRYIFVED